MSAKLRVTLWFTLMVLILAAMVLVFVLVINANAITDDPAGRLVKAVLKNTDQIEFDHGALDWSDVNAYSRGVYSVFLDADGKVLYGAMPQGFDSSLPFQANTIRSTYIANEEYLIYDSMLDSDILAIWVRGTVSATDRSGLMKTILTLTVTLLPALLLLTIGGGWLISSSAFKPLDKILSAADSIYDGKDLSARVAMRRGPSEMRRLSHAFDRMFERLEHSFNTERQFASDVSHELRTPITVILAECDRAKRKNVTSEDFIASIDVIQEQGKHMSELVQSLLSLTRMQHGTERYPTQKSDMSEFTRAVADEFLPADRRGITLHTDIDSGVEAAFNPSLMARVIQNLLQNAYKYGNDNGNIWLSLRKNGSGAALSVRDDGIGIAQEDQKKIWQRFWQADAARGEDGGSGLGLAMVKEIAEFHGGSAEVESTPGHGSTFTVRLP